MTRRVAILTHSLPPYRVDLFNELQRIAPFEAQVFVSTLVERNRRWKPGSTNFSFRRASGLSVRWNSRAGGFEHEKEVHLPLALYRDLRGYRPHAVLTHEMGARSIIASLYCRSRIPFGIWTEVSRHTEKNIGSIKRQARGWLAGRAAGWCAFMSEAAEYVRDITDRDVPVVIGPNAVADELYRRGQLDDAKREEARRELGLTGTVLLYVGHLNELKGLRELFTALETLDDVGTQLSVLLVGYGSLEGELKQRAATLPVPVRFHPYAEGEQLVRLYQLSDCLVFPSLSDVWGLVVNEAMASRKPALCSRYAGVARDLVVPNVTGWIFDPRSTAGTAAALRRVIAESERLPRMGEAASRRVAAFGIAESARALSQTCEMLLDGTRARPPETPA